MHVFSEEILLQNTKATFIATLTLRYMEMLRNSERTVNGKHLRITYFLYRTYLTFCYCTRCYSFQA